MYHKSDSLILDLRPCIKNGIRLFPAKKMVLANPHMQHRTIDGV